MIRNLLFISLICCCLSCKDRQTERPAVSFYYWKTKFALSSSEKQLLEELKVRKLYVRYFDIKNIDHQAFPVSTIQFEQLPEQTEIIPVVFIRNDVMLDPAIDVELLARQTWEYLRSVNQAHQIHIREIQIDCDWSLNSKERFFRYLQVLKDQSGVLLSATLRLHQVKYPEQTGIPPVDKGVLMYYNMGQIDTGKGNSIYEKNIAGKYLKSLRKYPLNMDIALPIFSWGIQIRNNQVVHLISKVHPDDLNNDPGFIQTDSNRYQAVQGMFRHGTYYREDDLLKLEYVTFNQCREMLKDLGKHLRQPATTVIFFDLDEKNLTRYGQRSFEELLTGYKP